MEGGHDCASKGVLLIPSSLCVPGNPRWNAAAYLDIVGPDIMGKSPHDARDAWSAEIYVHKAQRKNGKDVAILGAIGEDVLAAVRFCGALHGNKIEDVLMGCVLRVVVATKVAGKRCTIRCHPARG